MKRYYVYKFYNKDKELLYIGSTDNLNRRMYNHLFESQWEVWKNYASTEIRFIEYAVCHNATEHRNYEFYYIDKLKPQYNKALSNKYNKDTKDDLDFKYILDLKKYIKIVLKRIYIKNMKAQNYFNYIYDPNILTKMIDDTLLRINITY